MEVPVVAYPLVTELIEKLGSSSTSRVLGIMLLGEHKESIVKLQSILLSIRHILYDAEKASIEDRNICMWLKKLRDAALYADSAVEELRAEGLRQILLSHLYNPDPKVFKIFTWKFQHVLNTFYNIAVWGRKFQFVADISFSEKIRSNFPVIESELVYGRDEDKEGLVNFLVNGHNNKYLPVVSIYGPEGIGKTTLARFVCNDERIKREFDIHVWLWMSPDSDPEDITWAFVEGVTGNKCDLARIGSVEWFLEKVLNGKRVLLVLDAVSEKFAAQELAQTTLKSLMSGGKQGSKVVVTTSSLIVAQQMGSALMYPLEVLSTDHSLMLFRQRAFGFGREEETPTLVQVGKEIVRKCRGLPLAVKAMGSLMADERREAEWLLIMSSKVWTLPVYECKILPALKLSYGHLPSILKQCFAYCSLFPKDFVFSKEKLVSLWIAEGIIRSSNEAMDLEDIGNRYFDSLLQRSFFQDAVKDDFGNIVSCKMHILFHDLAYYVAQDDVCTMRDGVVNSIPQVCRHLSVTSNRSLPDTKDDICTVMDACLNVKLRSLLVSGRVKCVGEFNTPEMKNLRLLDVSNTMVGELPKSIGNLNQLTILDLSNTTVEALPESISYLYKLKLLDLSNTKVEVLTESITSLHNLLTLNISHCVKLGELPLTIGKLRYLRLLDLSHTNIQALPESISKLRSLQTLNLNNCSQLRELPKGTQFVRNLKHLDISGLELICMPINLGRLRSLRTLPLFVSGKERGRTIKELQHLNHIKGILRITCLCNVEDSVEAMIANLAAKADLRSLELWWRKDWTRQWGEVVTDWAALSPPSRENIDVDIFENLQPHPNLRRLTIEDYGGCRFPTWLTKMDRPSPLPNLESFSLYNLENCESLPPLGLLPSLKHLQMESMYALKRIDDLGGTFFSLKYLKLQNLPALEVWFMPECGMFPSLRTLSIIGCPKLRIQPCLPSSLLELELESVNGELLGECLYKLSGLKKLKIAHFEASEAAGWRGLQYLSSLQELEIMDCYMTCLPDSLLQKHFSSLRNLNLTLNNQLNTLGEGRGGEPPLFFSELRHLKVEGCDELIDLPRWLGGLNCLRSFELSYCDNLKTLPTELPAGLTQLTICGCPLLERRCERDVGEDWPNIAHILDIVIVSAECSSCYQASPQSPEYVDAPYGKSMFSHYKKAFQDSDSDETENFRLNIPPQSAPASGVSSPALSPRKMSNVDYVPSDNFLDQLQLCSAPELPSNNFMTGFSSQTSPEESSTDCSSLYSSTSKSSLVRSQNPSPLQSPLDPKVYSENSATWHDSNDNTNVHSLPLPPMQMQPSFAHPNTAKPEPSPWQKQKLIGRGTFGNVYVATNRNTGALCAVKEVHIFPDDPKSAECLKQLEQEIKVLIQLKHPNIVQYYGSEMTEGRFYIYLEYVYPGSINKYVCNHGEVMTESMVCNFTWHILKGLAYLHGTKNIHRDIKGANLLVDINGVVKIADFGLAKHLSRAAGALSLKGDPYWMAPEVVRATMHKDIVNDYAADIWSLGCAIIEMFTGKHPWSGLEGSAALFKILHKDPPIPDTLSSEGKDFLRCCFRRNPSDRPTAMQLLEHPFIRNSQHHKIRGSIHASQHDEIRGSIHALTAQETGQKLREETIIEGKQLTKW